MFGRKKKHQAITEAYQAQARAHLEAAGVKDVDALLSGEGIEEMVRAARSGAAYAQRDAAAAYQDAHPDAAAPTEDPLDALARVAEMHRQGLITDEQFAAEKARLLAE